LDSTPSLNGRRTHELAQLSVSTMLHDKILHAIELLGTKVAPEVRRETAEGAVSSRRSEETVGIYCPSRIADLGNVQ
jgi:hypothetical protein